MKKFRLDIHALWAELQRRRVVRLALYYLAGAWVAMQAADVLLNAFERSALMPWVVAGLIAGFPVAVVLSWFFDLTPAGIERTGALPAGRDEASWEPPPGSLAVLPFANLSDDADNEYFSDGLAEEIRNELARVPGLRVAARTSSFAFKNRHEDVRGIARLLNVAAVLEGGVRKHADAVRIYVQLVGAREGYQLWSANFDRKLEDIFRVQSEIAGAVAQAVAPLSVAPAAAQSVVAGSFEAYNLYLRGRHHFHKRTQDALIRAVDCFEQAIALDPGYALAYSGLADSCVLLSARFYGNLTLEQVLAKALPAAVRALELAPALAEAHASLGLIRRHQGDLDGAEGALRRAIVLNPGYSTALVRYGLVLGSQGRFREAEECDREAFRIDPLSPIVNANVGFDRLRYGDTAAARERFEAAIEIDPAFPVPHYGMARVRALEGDLSAALQHMDTAIRNAPTRAYYRARKGVLLLEAGEIEQAAALVDGACCMTPGNPFDADLVVALHVAREERDALGHIARAGSQREYDNCQRAQAALALGDFDGARALYEQLPPDRAREITDLATDDWPWRLPHVINLAHLRLRDGDPRGAAELEQLLLELDTLDAHGMVSALADYWAASANAVLGRGKAAQARLARAASRGWRHTWWQRVDWNLAALNPVHTNT